jgi:hypothetical protein
MCAKAQRPRWELVNAQVSSFAPQRFQVSSSVASHVNKNTARLYRGFSVLRCGLCKSLF